LAILAFAGEHIGFRLFLPETPQIVLKYGNIVMQAAIGGGKFTAKIMLGQRLGTPAGGWRHQGSRLEI
jgi:hypothetical protein